MTDNATEKVTSVLTKIPPWTLGGDELTLEPIRWRDLLNPWAVFRFVNFLIVAYNTERNRVKAAEYAREMAELERDIAIKRAAADVLSIREAYAARAALERKALILQSSEGLRKMLFKLANYSHLGPQVLPSASEVIEGEVTLRVCWGLLADVTANDHEEEMLTAILGDEVAKQLRERLKEYRGMYGKK